MRWCYQGKRSNSTGAGEGLGYNRAEEKQRGEAEQKNSQLFWRWSAKWVAAREEFSFWKGSTSRAEKQSLQTDQLVGGVTSCGCAALWWLWNLICIEFSSWPVSPEASADAESQRLISSLAGLKWHWCREWGEAAVMLMRWYADLTAAAVRGRHRLRLWGTSFPLLMKIHKPSNYLWCWNLI